MPVGNAIVLFRRASGAMWMSVPRREHCVGQIPVLPAIDFSSTAAMLDTADFKWNSKRRPLSRYENVNSEELRLPKLTFLSVNVLLTS